MTTPQMLVQSSDVQKAVLTLHVDDVEKGAERVAAVTRSVHFQLLVS